MSLQIEQPHRIAFFDACVLACDQCEVLSRVSHADAQARALEAAESSAAESSAGCADKSSGHVPPERGAAAAAANLKMAAA